MQNLRDKLLKAGLVTEEQAKSAQAGTERGPQERRGPRHAGPLVTARPQPLPPAARPPLGAVPKLPPMPGSKAHQRLSSRQQLEADKQLRDLVATHEVAVEPGATVFHFVTRKGRLRRLELTEAQAKRLERGELAVVERPEPARIEHSLVPAEVAERAEQLSAKAIRFFNRPGAPVGFLSDEEIKGRQAQEAAGSPDGDEGDGGPAPGSLDGAAGGA